MPCSRAPAAETGRSLVAVASVMNKQKRVRSEIDENKLWSLVSHCFSKEGVFVSMVLVFAGFLCSYFSRLTVKL